jgi:predicted amidohydrolase YtcJ
MRVPELVLTGGRIRTLDGARPSASSVAIADGEIVAVGSDREVLAHAGVGTERVDLAGAAVVPGLTDSHTHALPNSNNARGVDLLDARSLDEIRAEVAAERARCEPGAWIFGWGLDYNAFADTGIDGRLIEEAAGGAPTLLRFMDFHTALATPRALEFAGVDGPVPFESNAEIVCVDGHPTGELRESAAIRLVQAVAPEMTDEQRYDLTVDNLRRMAAAGLTATHLMDGTLATHETLRELEANGDLALRFVAPFWIHPDTPREMWDEYLGDRDACGRRWRAGVAKFFIDGVIDSGTGWLYEPDTEGKGTLPFWPDPARYRQAVTLFSGHGFQCVTHACGDRAVREALDAYRDAPAAEGVHHRIEHIETLQPQDLPRFAAQGVVASMQAQHMMWLAPDRSDNWSRRLGPERCRRAFPIRSLIDSGAMLTLGSDWPVARFDPREGMAAARLRRPPRVRNRAAYDDQAIDALAALEGYTTWPARTVGHAHCQGRVTPGFWGDLTVFAEDPVECPADDLPDNPVLMTIVDGEIVHRASTL